MLAPPWEEGLSKGGAKELRLASSARWPSSRRPSSPSLPPFLTGEEGEGSRRGLEALSLPSGGGEAGRERVGRVRDNGPGAATLTKQSSYFKFVSNSLKIRRYSSSQLVGCTKPWSSTG